MISLLRRLRAFPIPMESSTLSPTLAAVAHRLRRYKPPPTPFDDFEDPSPAAAIGFAESAATPQIPPRLRLRRAAVLVCLFEGDSGELRVILTKRSSTLSSHSGQL